MTELTLDQKDGTYIVHYEAQKVEFTDVTEIFEVITDWYNRYSSINEDFSISEVEFHGRFKGKGSD